MPAFDPIAFDSAFDIGSLSTGVGPFGFVFGFDPFDSLMTASADILEDQSAPDSYNKKSAQVQNFTVIATVPCYVSSDAGSGREAKVEKKSSIAPARVFMRPPVLPGGVPLSTRHWLKIEDSFYNVWDVIDPGLLGHHLECMCDVVTS